MKHFMLLLLFACHFRRYMYYIVLHVCIGQSVVLFCPPLSIFSLIMFNAITQKHLHEPSLEAYIPPQPIRCSCGALIFFGWTNHTNNNYKWYSIALTAWFWIPSQKILKIHTKIGVFTARRSYGSAVVGVVILSVCPPVCLSHACFVTNPKNLPAMFYTI